MTKHKINDIVRYTNRTEKIDVFGEIVAIFRDSWAGGYSVLIEPFDGDQKTPKYSFGFQNVSSGDSAYQFDANKFNQQSGTLLRSKKRCLWAPLRSKNLVPGYPPKDYDPTQNGDRDEDI